MSLAAWLHDLSPIALRIGGLLTIRWYGVAYLLGFLLGYLILRWLVGRSAALIPRDRVGDAILAMIVGVIVGGRLGYVLIYDLPLLWRFDSSFPWWGVLQIQNGGMASHGGMVGVIIASWRISRGYKTDSGQIIGRCSPMHIMDLTAMLCPFGLMLGRLANFVNGELLGNIVAEPGQPAPWWAVKFPQERLETNAPVLNSEQQAAMDQLLDGFRQPGAGDDLAYAHMLEALQRPRTPLDMAVASRLDPLISARIPSQLLQAIAEGLILGAVVWFVARKPRLAGIVGAVWFITYGLLRILTELWRLPDAHLTVQRILGLSRGQWLSVAMVLVGNIAIVLIRRRGGTPIGGWARLQGNRIFR